MSLYSLIQRLLFPQDAGGAVSSRYTRGPSDEEQLRQEVAKVDTNSLFRSIKRWSQSPSHLAHSRCDFPRDGGCGRYAMKRTRSGPGEGKVRWCWSVAKDTQRLSLPRLMKERWQPTPGPERCSRRKWRQRERDKTMQVLSCSAFIITGCLDRRSPGHWTVRLLKII